ncbi:ribonuclease D [Pontibacterium granulatum]|uniref:ribonuclease D n=1 Tax=Pontibacterium granulatum TaxID=2036029 RepID=UPI00249B774B|nr:ribonuclease D [Pontibacterium granulatum]MDI3324483.1 ribonuclease D [Pontibacterium granulatum]
MSQIPAAYDWQVLETSADQPIVITENASLAKWCEHWQTLPMVALDTEFQRVETFYPIPGLIQLADDQHCFLIDPLAVTDFEPLKALFRNPDVLKVLHAATEDLELFQNSLGVLPEPVFDTQIAAAILNWGFSMGLQRMLQTVLGVEVGKHETTSDWLRRPLTASQEHYAALDVAYLPAICQKQKDALEARGMLEWLQQESDAMLKQAVDEDPDGAEYYKRFTQMWTLQPHKIAALRDLTAWREQTCRSRDVPRNRILRNQALLEIVNQWPKNNFELSRVDEIKRAIIRNDGAQILSFLKNAQKSAEENPPEPILRPLPYFWNKPLKKLKAIVRECAADLDVAPEIMLRKKELDALIRSGLDDNNYQMPEAVSPWRARAVGEKLLAALKEIGKQN